MPILTSGLAILISANAECKKQYFLASDVRGRILAHIVLPNGKGTVGDWLMPQIDQAYESGKIPPLLPGW
jgi:hypothetical protein